MVLILPIYHPLLIVVNVDIADLDGFEDASANVQTGWHEDGDYEW